MANETKITERTWFPLSILAAAVVVTATVTTTSVMLIQGNERNTRAIESMGQDLADGKAQISEIKYSVERLLDKMNDRWTGTMMRLYNSEAARLNPAWMPPDVDGILSAGSHDTYIGPRSQK